MVKEQVVHRGRRQQRPCKYLDFHKRIRSLYSGVSEHKNRSIWARTQKKASKAFSKFWHSFRICYFLKFCHFKRRVGFLMILMKTQDPHAHVSAGQPCFQVGGWVRVFWPARLWLGPSPEAPGCPHGSCKEPPNPVLASGSRIGWAKGLKVGCWGRVLGVGVAQDLPIGRERGFCIDATQKWSEGSGMWYFRKKKTQTWSSSFYNCWF